MDLLASPYISFDSSVTFEVYTGLVQLRCTFSIWVPVALNHIFDPVMDEAARTVDTRIPATVPDAAHIEFGKHSGQHHAARPLALFGPQPWGLMTGNPHSCRDCNSWRTS